MLRSCKYGWAGQANQNAEAGFTLIELLLSIVLGLLLVAAGVQLFYGGLVSYRIQQGGADVQDNGAFGTDFITKNVRMANYGNITNRSLTDIVPFGGIVLTADTATSVASNLPAVRTSSTSSTAYIPAGLLTSGSGDTKSSTTYQWQGLSNVSGGSPSASIPSDQLTIIFQAPSQMADCEGGTVNAGDYLVERFFLRADDITTPAASDANMANLVLACNAGVMTATSVAAATNCTATAPTTCALLQGSGYTGSFGGKGQVVMNRVDQLHFLLGTVDASGNYVYYTINGYKNLTGTKPRILSIQMSTLVRSLANTSNSTVDPTRSYAMLDQTVTPNTVTTLNNNRYVRQVYTTTVALRNAMGDAS